MTFKIPTMGKDKSERKSLLKISNNSEFRKADAILQFRLFLTFTWISAFPNLSIPLYDDY